MLAPPAAANAVVITKAAFSTDNVAGKFRIVSSVLKFTYTASIINN